jgi:hypothetical protein
MVEMGFPHREREAEWHAWYMSHIRVLLTVPGFDASQRFQAVVPMPAPYLALHQVVSPALFDSDIYRSRGGPASTGMWRALHTNWSRNVLEGLDATPDVPADKYVLLLRDARDLALPEPAAVTWLRGVGLDRSIAECGVAVIDDPIPFLDLARRDPRICLYRPISEKIRAVA